MIINVIAVLISYFIGNVSPAILLGKLYGVDIKKEGSGNAGTTNVLRVLGKKAAAATLMIDILKGVIAVLLAKYFCEPEVALICGLAVFCGHIWPAAFKFKGGKGVATAFGVMMAVYPLLGLSALVIVLVVILITRRVSAGSLVGAALLPALAFIFNPDDISQTAFLLWSGALAVIVIIKHRSNLLRLLKGQEPKLSFKKKGD
jgi:glycerol-3-phosphate acyltransferase PlsY